MKTFDARPGRSGPQGHLITHVHTTAADVHKAMCTQDIHEALREKDLVPPAHFVDAAYVSAELLVGSRADFGIDLVGPPPGNSTWQTKVQGAYTNEQFTIDWEKRAVHCPQGVASAAWHDYLDKEGKPYHLVQFPKHVCGACHARALCTKAKHNPPEAKRALCQISLLIACQETDRLRLITSYTRFKPPIMG